MEKPQQNESRKKLADKLRGARELDKGLADQYLAKVSATEDYKTNKKQTRSEFKEFKNSERDAEKQEKIDALKREIEGMGTAAPEETNDGLNVVAEEDPALIPEFRKEDTPILPAEPEKVQPVELTGEIKNMTPEGQVIINSLIKRKEAFEIKTKEETEGIKQDYQKSLDSIDSRVSGFNDKYKEFCESTDLRIKARNDKYKEFCDEIDLRIKAVQEKEEGDKWQKEREVADLNREKQNEGFRTEREVADLNREKQNEGFRTEREVQSIKNEKYRVDSRYEQDLRDAKNRAERALKEIEEKIAKQK